MRHRRRFLIGGLIAVPVAATLALALTLTLMPGHALANPPTRQTVDLTLSFTLPTSFTGCNFTVTAQQTGSGVVTTFYDKSGNPTDIFTRTPHLTVTYYSQSGASYTSDSTATTHLDLVNNTITYDGLQQHIVIPGQGNVGAATGHVVFNTQTGALIVAHGQTTFLTPFSAQICALLGQ
jgi:hypothetical protein